jgi:outer membrane protein OmpA-like peptidoglycan-associated protein
MTAAGQCPEGSITSKENLVANGDFESGGSGFRSEYVQSAQAGAGTYLIVRDAKEFSYQYFTGKGDQRFLAVDGANGPNKVVWEQEVFVKPNTTYFFSAWTLTLNTKTGPPAVLQFSINDRLLGRPFSCPAALNSWEQFFVNWTSADQSRAVIRIVSQNPDWDGNDFGLDKIRFYECTSPGFEAKLESAKVGETIELRNIFFETAKSTLKAESFSQLDMLLGYLTRNPVVEIEIAGHTDAVGDNGANMRLSRDRANAVARYLVEKGVDKNRLVVVGYGESQPIDSNETLEGRQINRRVEFKILKM